MKSEYANKLKASRVAIVHRALVGLGLLSLATMTPAATVAGGAFVDWNSLSIEFLQPGASASPTPQATSVFGYFRNQDLSAQSLDWASSISASADNGEVRASMAADATFVSVGGTLTSVSDYVSATMDANRSGLLQITGSGILVVSLAGTVSSDISDVDANTDYAYSYSRVEVSLASGAFSSYGALESWSDLSGYTLLSDLQSGVITAALSVNDGDRVQFNVFASTELSAGKFNPVPLPTSLPLFGSALLGLSGIQRARSRSARMSSSNGA